MANFALVRARTRALLSSWGGKLLWSCLCAAEVLISTALHCAFAAFIMHCAITKDVLALLPNLLNPFNLPSQTSSPSLAATSPESSSSGPSSPFTPRVTSPSFWTSPQNPSYSYLMSCSVLFSSPSTYPFRVAEWLKRSASAISSSLPWSPSLSRNLEEAQQFQGGAVRGTSRRGTSLLQLDVPGAGTWHRTPGNETEIRKGCASCDHSALEEPSRGTPLIRGSVPSGGAAAPIVLLHGIFGFGHGRLGKLSYFGGVERQHENVFVPDLGSLTSIHDRARRLFYYLKGGTIDYGEEHSTEAGHARFGPALRGQFKSWDENYPVHLVGHSAGVQTARLLQQMLADKEFEGFETSADWVASITSLSGALNGTTRVYIDGLSAEDGETMTPISLLQVLRIGVLIYDWLNIPMLRDYYSFGFEHFGLTWHQSGIKGIWNALVCNACGPFKSGDWILPDLSPQRALRLNRDRIQTHPNTYYFSYATVATQQLHLFGQRFVVPAGLSTVHPLFTLRCLQMSLWSFPPSVHLPYPEFRDEEWQHNDGALNVISMLYPMAPAKLGGEASDSESEGEVKSVQQQKRSKVVHPHKPMPTVAASASPAGSTLNSPHVHHHKGSTHICTLPSCHRPAVPAYAEGQPFIPGVWYYSLLEADHILFVISPRRAGVHFDILYRSIFSRCRSMRGTHKRRAVATSSRTAEIEQVLEDVEGKRNPHRVGVLDNDDCYSSSASLASGIDLCGSSSSSLAAAGSECEGQQSHTELPSDVPSEQTDADVEDETEEWMDVVERHPSWESERQVAAEDGVPWKHLDAADLAWPKVTPSELVEEDVTSVRKIHSDVGTERPSKGADKWARRRKREQQLLAASLMSGED